MKFKTTRKAVENGLVNVKQAGYCELQHILKNHEPIAYNSGVYGWNFDVYAVYGVTICTGYRNMPGERVQCAEEYEEKSREIWENFDTPYEERREKAEQLLKDFCKLNGGLSRPKRKVKNTTMKK